MKKLLHTLLVLVASTLVINHSLAAPKSFQDLGNNPAKTAKAVWFGPNHADFGKIGNIGYPKRVGLLSFYLFDTGSFEFSAFNATYGQPSFTDAAGRSYVKAGESHSLGNWNANIFATLFANEAIPKMKTLFAEKGMELLSPSEYLDTDAKLKAYTSFELPKTGFQKVTEASLAILDKNPHASGAADGFLLIPTHIFSGNAKSLRALDTLRQELNLDAFVVVVNTTATNKKTVRYTGTQVLFYGPNPVPLPQHKMKAKFWTPMIPYPSGTYGKGFKGMDIYTWKNKDLESIKGYAGVIEAIVNKSLEKIDKKLK